MSCNKKSLQQHIKTSIGKFVTLKDQHNLGSKPPPQFSDVATFVQDNADGAILDCITDDSSALSAILYQDQPMQDMFKRYPSMMFVDATYKVNNLNMPVFLLIVEDGNGAGHIVCVWLVTSECGDLITKCLDWTQTEVVMTDKDFVEREVFQKGLPSASLMICRYHMMKIFKRQITKEKCNVTSAQRGEVLKELQKLCNEGREQE